MIYSSRGLLSEEFSAQDAISTLQLRYDKEQ